MVEQIAALEIEHLSKTFAETRALKDVSMVFPRGSVTALLGQNGSGKSTLVKILAGFHTPDADARVSIGGREITLPIKPSDVYQQGLRFVHQDMALVDEMTVAENFAFLQGFPSRTSLSPIPDKKYNERVRQSLAALGLDIDPTARIIDIAPSQRMMVAIARAFADGNQSNSQSSDRVVFLDEPTAFLPRDSVAHVHRLIAAIAAAGGTVVYVTHRLDEVLSIADRVIVLRDGAVTAQRAVKNATAQELSDLIAGGVMPAKKSSTHTDATRGEVLVRITELAGDRVSGINLDIHRGEIVGVAGLIGSGRSELARILAGIQPLRGGSMTLDGADYSPRNPREAIRRGVAFAPPDRRGQGIIAEMTFRENVTLGDLGQFFSRGLLQGRRERSTVEALMKSFGVQPPRSERLMGEFSGGNQQKGIIAKFLRLNPSLLVADEPTQGVDVLGKRDIAELLREFADNGGSVLLASTDFDEVSSVCDRVIVLDRGQQVGVYEAREITEQILNRV
ncbi:MAG TPA: sugar ABC transporter ATP-binding protein [Thermomicrobiales bacterium]|nr:sugar ABC transporter ATP-binding protein [Thermomicrobiales bacterium]